MPILQSGSSQLCHPDGSNIKYDFEANYTILKNMKGRIKFVNYETKYGFITGPEHTDYYIGRADIPALAEPLRPGDEVEFEPVKVSNGKCMNATKLKVLSRIKRPLVGKIPELRGEIEEKEKQ